MKNAAAAPLKRWAGKKLRAPVPMGRDPFVNTPLLPVGPGADGQDFGDGGQRIVTETFLYLIEYKKQVPLVAYLP